MSPRVVALLPDQVASFELGIVLELLSRGAQRAPVDVVGQPSSP